MPSVGLSEGLDGPEDHHHLKVCQMVLRFGREKKRLEKEGSIIEGTSNRGRQLINRLLLYRTN
jgi:hypothetical protein